MGGTRKRILVIDDDERLLRILEECLAFGPEYAVETASSGADGLAAFERSRPDLLILDIRMADMSGLEVLTAVRAADTALPVIMLTGNDDVAVAAEALRRGASSYAPKPVHLQYLEHLIGVLLNDAPRPSPV